jgi:rubrerythrin
VTTVKPGREGGWRAPGAPALMLTSSATGTDVDAAQTAASIENVAIAAYRQVAGLLAVQTLASPARLTVAGLLTGAAQHHADHLTAFNAAATRLGGRAQTAPDTAFASSVVQPALSAATTAAQALQVLAQLELVAAETYAAEAVEVSDRQLKNSFAAITGVEAQHAGVLLAAASLLSEAKDSALVFPWDGAGLPATAATDGTPSAFLRTDQARPPTEGATR